MREHSRTELVRKLGRNFPQDVIYTALDNLESQGLQSDGRYTELYVDLRIRKGYGPVRIQQELREKGISDELIVNWLDPTDSLWRERLQQVVKKKFGAEPANDQREMARRARFLEYRGFPAHLIRDYLYASH